MVRLSRSVASTVALSAVCSFVDGHGLNDGLTVKTTHFTVKGTVETNTTNVRVFRRIPYAEPPLGANRFKPPVTKKPELDVLDSTEFGPSCIPINNGQPTPYTEYLPGFLLAPGATTGEDCLSLALWAPREKKEERLPVIIYIPGGGFTGGGANSPYKYGGPIVRDNQDVIVIAINYRVNIFGFPNAASLNQHNLNPGLLDQRKAVEWVYDNVAAFGGDPAKITLWGQSAGGSSVDKYAYAWADDPIVRGLIADSGVASLLGTTSADTSNFTYVASQIGCNQEDADDQFSCVQQKNASEIIKVLNTYNATQNSGKGLTFTPTADNETSWADYTDLRNRGRFARLPLLTGINDNEFATLLPLSPNGPNQTAVDRSTNASMNCPAAAAARSRTEYSIPAWRYRYFGQFPNLNPVEWLGAYHSSELPIIFNTSNLLGPNTDNELATVEYLQGAWLSFVRDPENGLINYGWPLYNETTESLVQLGLEGNPKAVFAPAGKFDETCT
ncbi:alpha/beta-hydrolase [Aaosphaeria arxii CBS 175.79]|uniref:Carboxylic ester hydrolase n=1 Tax=Aaosphaeria arxii CBS 175.79 TaxID=1450172 RepID=A0A6A5XBG9_9PLEO|nr:alpha/beta-hydrolase [Aaosphaeria arxii CBS 175.79]KAF2010253.1 alpha/beta-hydrolase [Aaosphaeria arxii CBS 175.79]